MFDSAENDGRDKAAASASANASAAAGGGPSGSGSSADNPTVPPLGPALPTETLRSRNGTEVLVTIVPRTAGNKAKRSWV